MMQSFQNLSPVRLVLLLVATLAFSCAFMPGAFAQSAEQATPLTTQQLPNQLNEEAIRNILSELSDREVRALLIERLTLEAQRQAKESATDVGLGEVITETVGALGLFFADVIIKIPNLPGEIAKGFSTFADQRGNRDISQFYITLMLAFGVGGALTFAASRLLPASLNHQLDPNSQSLRRRTTILVGRFAAQSFLVALFAFTALALNAWFNRDAPADHETIKRLVTAVAWPWFAFVVARFLLAPKRSDLRLCAIDDTDARWLATRIVFVTSVFYVGFGFTGWLNAFGSVYQDSWHGFWVNLAFHVALAQTIWQGRFVLRRILSGQDRDTRVPGAREPYWHKNWHVIALSLIILHWFVIETVVATSHVPETLFVAMITTLALLMALPFLNGALSGVVSASFDHIDADDVSPVLAAANEQTKQGTLRIARVLGVIVLIFIILGVWGLDLVAMAERGIGARFGAELVSALVIAAVAYVFWEGIRILIDRQIAMERVTLGLDSHEDEGPGEGEGGGAGARLGTLLPLVRVTASAAIVVLAALTILGQFGVNVLPLLAGAGVIGLAVGFGAQTLVKDVVAGVFFLIDDSFRIGEYIDVGHVKGTVERISIRSMQLRHHRGVLNTVPFGDLGHIANFSRDWVIMKFPLRLPYGTDTEKVRKMIKKLGQELLTHPEFGEQFLQPLKSQGVVQMEDSAMIVPVKFMARPGEQWMLRRLVLTRIHELFEEKGIRFANREVTVRLGDDRHGDVLDADDRKAIAGAAGRLIHDEEQNAATPQPSPKP